MAATTHTPLTIHQRTLKPKRWATSAPAEGPITWAVDQAIVYSPAYCPRLDADVRDIQKEFMNGIANISPIVASNIQKKGRNIDKGSKSNKI